MYLEIILISLAYFVCKSIYIDEQVIFFKYNMVSSLINYAAEINCKHKQTLENFVKSLKIMIFTRC